MLSKGHDSEGSRSARVPRSARTARPGSPARLLFAGETSCGRLKGEIEPFLSGWVLEGKRRGRTHDIGRARAPAAGLRPVRDGAENGAGEAAAAPSGGVSRADR